MARIPKTTYFFLAATLALAARAVDAQIVTTLAGSGAAGKADGPGAAASFGAPVAVAADPAGNVYVADSNNSRIRKITPDGTVRTFVDFTGGYPCHPTGVAVDGSGYVWVVDPVGDGIDGGCLGRYAPDGRSIGFNLQWPAVALPPLTFDDAIAIAVDRVGNLYATSYLSGVLKFDTTGKGTVLTKELSLAQAIAVDGFGNVFVAGAHSILRVNIDGAITTLAGSGLSGSVDGPGLVASFANNPTGLAVDSKGNVYVADKGNNKIRRITPNGIVETLAGTGDSGSADGPAGAATFDAPSGVALDAAGNLYVADTGSRKIRKITAVAVLCSVGCTDWTVPSVARTAGPNGSFWTSDLTIHNRGALAVPVTLKFLGHDADGSAGPEMDATIGAHETVTYADVLASVFSIAEGWGAVQVRTGSDQIAVRSRTSTLRAGGSIGDGVPGVRIDRFVTDQTAPSPVLTGLGENDRFRTNLILVNGSSAPVDVLVTAIDSSGAALGSKTYTLAPLEMIQDAHFLAGPEFGAGAKTDATVALSTMTPGGAFTAYAAVIDNGSNAPTTVLPQ